MAVEDGVLKVGTNGDAEPVSVADPEAYPVRVVFTVTVANCPGFKPVTVSGIVEPLIVPLVIVPAVVA